MIGHHTFCKENEDLSLLVAPVLRQKLLCFNEHVLITRRIMRSEDAHCNTKE